ncbi:MAG TPA: hypothetical protein VGR67_16085 [Candidatus Polarisedimenticolia bacterium]|jgi:hypothetical protein|nr:hypothetical protein [Candidatus Polarisedimenticolia bacterium]
MHKLRIGLATILLFTATATAAGKVEGIGAFPLSESTVSMWLNEVVDGKPRALAIVYFIGAPGWHNRKWKTDFNYHRDGGKDASYKLISDDLVLSLTISADMKTALVQGKSFPLENSNVFLVKGADGGAKKETVQAVGHFVLEATAGNPASVDALNKNPDLATAVLGAPK